MLLLLVAAGPPVPAATAATAAAALAVPAAVLQLHLLLLLLVVVMLVLASADAAAAPAVPWTRNAVLGRGKTAQKYSPRTGKHHGSEGRRRYKKGGEKLPNVTSETHRKWGFLSYLSRSKMRFLGKETPRNEQGNTMAVKDVTSETHRNWGFLSYLGPAPKRGSWARKHRAKPQPPDRETPWQWRTEKAQKRRRKTP